MSVVAGERNLLGEVGGDPDASTAFRVSQSPGEEPELGWLDDVEDELFGRETLGEGPGEEVRAGERERVSRVEEEGLPREDLHVHRREGDTEGVHHGHKVAALHLKGMKGRSGETWKEKESSGTWPPLLCL